MTENEITLYSIFAGGLLVFIYALFFVYSRYRNASRSKPNLKERFGVVQSSYAETSSLSLLKEGVGKNNFFQSKMPKVEGLEQWIQHAGISVRPIVLILESSALGICFCAVLIFIFKINIISSVLLGTLGAFLVPWSIFTILTSRRRNKFLAEFPIALDMICRALRAGHSADRSLEMVAEQGGNIVGETFRTITNKIHMGEPPEIALGEVANSLGIDEFRMLAIVLILQKETGGSLTEAVDNFSKMIQARHNLRKKVKALSAEVRVTAMILTAIPFFITGAVYFTSPHYLDPLIDTENGRFLLMIGGVMLSLGIGIIMRMAYKEVY